ncbi:MAG: prephenate dehydratase [Spirochaetes bacterium]|nr:prephenate dehydratase [Spirochaetota bacterium]
MKNIPQLEKIRKQINRIDKDILELLHQRINLAKKVKVIKSSTHSSYYQPSREKEIFDLILKENKDIFPEKSLSAIFTEIFSASRKIQSELKIGYFGAQASFTHIAAIKLFGHESIYIPHATLRDIFVEVENDCIDFGVVPIENSNEGVVPYTMDLFMEFDHQIINEIYLPVEQNLVSLEKDINRIKILYAHFQSLGQCRTFIRNNLPSAKIIEKSSTSQAAREAARKKMTAALSSKLAAQIYKLNVLAESVQDNLYNYTRFLVIAKKPIKLKNNIKYKTSIVCGIKDRPGELFKLIKPFNDFKINMTKIESRPTRRKAWEYMFFIDFIGKATDKKVKPAISRIKKSTTYFKILGSYPAAKGVK